MDIEDVYHMVRKLEDSVNQLENDISSLQAENLELSQRIDDLEREED